MRTIEAAVGLLIIVAAIALACGAGSLIAPHAARRLWLDTRVVGLGCHDRGSRHVRRAANGTNAAGAQSWRTLFYLLFAVTLATTLPLVVDLLNLTSIAGFPLGYYVTAQGLLIFLAILAFRAATHLDRLDTVETSAPAREDV